jgi:epoxide hydrolase-like predicted phosphatase
MTLRAAVFDGGGVLTTPIVPSFLRFEKALGLPANSLLPLLRERGDDGSEPPFYELERGRLSEAEFWGRLPTELETRLGVRVVLPADASEIRRILWDRIRPNDRMLATARAIATGHRTALLTNGVREWAGLRALYRPEQFDVVIDSCEVGLRKPEREIYELVCERLNVEPREAAFVDDIPANVDSARALGMTGILFTTTEDALRQLRVLFPAAFAAS